MPLGEETLYVNVALLNVAPCISAGIVTVTACPPQVGVVYRISLYPLSYPLHVELAPAEFLESVRYPIAT